MARRRTVKSRAVLHDDPWVSVHRADISFDNGKKIKNFLLVRMKGHGFISVCARLADGRFLFSHQCRPVAGMSVESIAGVYDLNRKAAQVVREEMSEETGYRPKRLLRINSFGFYTETDRIDDRCHLFLAFGCTPLARRAVPDEKQGVQALILTSAQVRQKIRMGEIKDLATIAGICAHFAYEGGTLPVIINYED